MKALSVVVITFNEAHNIGRCLDSVQAVADDILVVDSFSTDSTVEIAREKGARIIQHPFEGYHLQREFAVRKAGYDHVLALDADEYLSEELALAIKAVKANWQYDGYKIQRLNKIGNTWIKHTSWYPDHKLRLFDRRRITIRSVRGHDVIEAHPGGTTGFIAAPLMHLTNYNLHDREFRVNQLSTEAARFYYDQGKKGSWGRILLKPVGRFLVEFILKRGFLGGFYGFAISVSSAHYVLMRELKLQEMRRLGRPYSQDDWQH